jgi:hypothetical protein
MKGMKALRRSARSRAKSWSMADTAGGSQK